MKFIVDELPKKPNDCPFTFPIWRAIEAYGCNIDHCACVDTTQCSYLITLDDYLNK